MRSFRDYLSPKGGTKPQHGASGTESNWFELGEIELSNCSLWIGDLSFIPSEDDGVVATLPPGTYQVEGKGIDYGGDRRVARLRIRKRGTNPTLGKTLDETWTDTAQTAVVDFTAFTELHDRLGDDAFWNEWERELGDRISCGTFRPETSPTATAYYVDSGFGDGTFPVRELTESGQTVGVEIEFINVAQRYPFAEDTGDDESKSPDSAPSRGESQAAEMIKEMLNAFAAKKTADPVKNRDAIKSAMDGILGEMKAKAIAATEDFKNHVLQLRRKKPPLRADWVITEDHGWLDMGKAAILVRAVEKAGFRRVGVYNVTQFQGYSEAIYLDPTNLVQATIDHSSKGDYLWIASRYTDGSVFMLTDSAGIGLPIEPWETVVRNTRCEAEELHAQFASMTPLGALVAMNPEDFPRLQEDSFTRTQAWRAERGGWTAEELRAQKSLGNSPADEELLRMLRHDSAETWLFSWLHLQKNPPFDPAHELGRLVVIHDDLDAGFLLNAWWCSTHDFDAKERLFEEGSAREAFAKVNADRGKKLKLVLQKASGLPADFYLPNS